MKSDTSDIFDDIFDLSKSLTKTKKAHGKDRKPAQAPDTKDAHLGGKIGSRVPNKGPKGPNAPVDRTLAPKKGPGEKTRKSIFPNAPEFRAVQWELPDATT